MINVREDYFTWKNKNGYNQHDIAVIMNCSRPAIASFETGRSPYPRGETLLRFLEVLYPNWDTANCFQADYVCPGCKETVPGPQQEAKHCIKCGFYFGDGCRACGHVNLTDAKFCNECGEKIVA